MPRSFSSFSRSVSWPVSARMSEVLPWSMCPAVPMMSGMSEVDGELGGVEDAAQIEQEAAVVDAAQDGRARGAEAGGDALGAHLRVLEREHGRGGAAHRFQLGERAREPAQYGQRARQVGALAIEPEGRPERSQRQL